MHLVSFRRCRAGHSSSSYHIVGAAGHHILWCQLKTLYFHLTWSQLIFNWLSVSTVENVKRNYISHNNDVGVAHSNSFFFLMNSLTWKVNWLQEQTLGDRKIPRPQMWNLTQLHLFKWSHLYICYPGRGFCNWMWCERVHKSDRCHKRGSPSILRFWLQVRVIRQHEPDSSDVPEVNTLHQSVRLWIQVAKMSSFYPVVTSVGHSYFGK